MDIFMQCMKIMQIHKSKSRLSRHDIKTGFRGMSLIRFSEAGFPPLLVYPSSLKADSHVTNQRFNSDEFRVTSVID